MESVEVCVVGGGVEGLATAWRLGVAGREALVLERFDLGHDRGSSHGANRIFRFAYPDQLYVRMAQDSLPLWRELEAASADDILRTTGGVDVGDHAILEGVAAALTSCGAAVERVPDAHARLPWLRVGGPAVFSPDTGVLAASRALSAMAAQARKLGVDIRERTAVLSMQPDDAGVTIRTEAAELRARSCILTAGAWTRSLLEPLGSSLPLRVTREQVFYFRSTIEILPFIHHGRITRYGVPAFGGAAGIKVAEHQTGEPTSADGRSFDMDPEGAARVSAYVEEALPDLDPEPVAFETCLYTNTPDEDFVFEVRGPLIVASACSGHGFKFAPLVGETLACLATGRASAFPLDRFSIDRFAR